MNAEKVMKTIRIVFAFIFGAALMTYAVYGWHMEWTSDWQSLIAGFIGFVFMFVPHKLEHVISKSLEKIFDATIGRFFGGGKAGMIVLFLLSSFAVSAQYHNVKGVRVVNDNDSTLISGVGQIRWDAATGKFRFGNGVSWFSFVKSADADAKYWKVSGATSVTNPTVTSSGTFAFSSPSGVTLTSSVQSVGLNLNASGSATGGIAMLSSSIQRNRLLWNTTGTYFESSPFGIGSAAVANTNLSLAHTFTASSGTNNSTSVSIFPTWNTTGTWVGTLRGVYYNPTNTSLIGATHIAFENTSGELRFGGVTQDDTKSQMLVKDATTNKVFWRDASTLGGGTTIASGQIAISDGTSLIGDANLTYGAGLFQVGGQSIFASDNAANNSVTTTLALQHTTSGAPAIGIGTGLNFIAETAIGNNETGVSIEAVTTDITAAAEKFKLDIKTMSGGIAATTRLTVDDQGITVPALTSGRVPIIGSGGLIHDDLQLTYDAIGNVLSTSTFKSTAMSQNWVPFTNINDELVGEAGFEYNASGNVLGVPKIQINTGVTGGSGLTHGRASTGSIAAGANVLVNVTLGNTMADTNYTVSVTIEDATSSASSLRLVHVESRSTTQVGVRVENTSAGAITGTIHVIAIHD